jgi:hypothetical protein
MIDPFDEAFHRAMGVILEAAMRRILRLFGIAVTIVVYCGREAIYAANLDPRFDSNELRQLQHPARLLDTGEIEQRGREVREFIPKPH